MDNRDWSERSVDRAIGLLNERIKEVPSVFTPPLLQARRVFADSEQRARTYALSPSKPIVTTGLERIGKKLLVYFEVRGPTDVKPICVLSFDQFLRDIPGSVDYFCSIFEVKNMQMVFDGSLMEWLDEYACKYHNATTDRRSAHYGRW